MKSNMYTCLFRSFIYIRKCNWNSYINWYFLEYAQIDRFFFFFKGNKFSFEGLGMGADSPYSLIPKRQESQMKLEETEKGMNTGNAE